MFYGQFENKLDDKNRLMIPKKMREQIGDKIFILEYLDGVISIFNPEEFDQLVVKANSISFTQEKARKFARKIIGSAIDVPVDKMGRIQIPMHYVNKYAITKEVIIIGVGDHIEIWNKDEYIAYEEGVDKEFNDIAENLFNN